MQQSTALAEKLDTEQQNTDVSFLGFDISMKMFCCVGVVCMNVVRQLFLLRAAETRRMLRDSNG